MLAACTSLGTTSAQTGVMQENSATTTEWKGQLSLVAKETSIAAAAQVEWEELWRKVGSEPPATLPDDSIAIGIFLGQRPTAGYGISILSAAKQDGSFVVAYRENKPSGAAAMVLTYPYLIGLYPKTGLPITFEKQP